jgi:hypothetical protein
VKFLRDHESDLDDRTVHNIFETPEHIPAGFGAYGLACGIDPDTLHRRKVDHEPAVTDGLARDAVASASNRNQQIVFTSETDTCDDISSTSAACHNGRVPIDHRVRDRAGRVVPVVARRKRTDPEAML